MSGGNPTVYTNDSGLALQASSGPITLTGTSLAVAAGSALIQAPITASGSLTVQGGATLNGPVTCSNLSLQTLAVSGAVNLQGTTTLQSITVGGAAALQAAVTVGGPLSGQAATLAGQLSVAQAATLQSTLQVGGNATLLGQLSVTGQAAFGAQVSFGSGVTLAANTTLTAYDQVVQDRLTVQSQLVATGSSSRPLSVASTSSASTDSVEIYYDRTAASSAAYAQTTLTPGGGFVLSTSGKPALTTNLSNQQTTATANRSGDTFCIKGDGTISTKTELLLDNSAAQSAQVARLGCDSSGLYISPASATKAVAVDLTGKLNATKGAAVLGGMTTDTLTVPSMSAGSLAATSITSGSLTCSTVSAGGSSVLALAGADANSTVTIPALMTASVAAPASKALTLAGADSNTSTVVKGRLQVDTLATATASSLTVAPPVAFGGTISAPQTSFGSVSVVAAQNAAAQLTLDASASASGDVATLAAAPSTGLQLSVAAGPVFTTNFGSMATAWPNAVTVSGQLTAAGALVAQGTLAVSGASVFGGGLAPSSAATLDLGTSSLKWRTAYIGTSLVLPNSTFTGKLSELTADLLNLTGAQSILYNNVRGLTLKNASTTASSTADIYFDRSAVSSVQTGGIGMGGDTQGLFLATNGVQRVNISTSGMVGVGALPVSPLTVQVGGSAQDFKGNGLYVFNPNTTSSTGSPQNAVITTQVQALNSSANAFHCFDNTQASWSIGIRGADSKFYLSPSNTSAAASPKLTLDNGGNATFAGGLLVGDGSASLPSYGFSTDTNTSTGFYHPAVSTIAATVGAQRCMQWNSDKSVTAYGNLGVTQSVTAAGATVTGFASLGSLGVNQNAAVTGTLTVTGVTNTSDTLVSSATTSTGMLRLAGKSTQQAEATMTFNRTGAGSNLWSMGQGTFSTTDDFTIGGGAGLGAVLQMNVTTGYVTLRYGGTSTSDRRLKKDISSLSAGSGLEIVKRLRPVNYRWASGGDSKRHLGFIAQDVQEVIGEEYGTVHEVVTASKPPELALAYTELIAPLVEAVKTLARQVEELKDAKSDTWRLPRGHVPC